ncbi:MAG: flagellar hook-length control protein FliK [Lachnospiraceae bacterium]|nr:flagellar hook-length control protein FliK [Lachnospiraceae bacterium]
MSLFSGVYGNHGYTDSSITGAVSGTASSASASGQSVNSLSGLSAGQTIEGKVIASNGDTVQIDIGTGTPVTAKLDHAMDLQKGQNVIFEVKTNSSQQITLSPLYTNLTNSSTALNALQAAGMTVTSDSLAMTSAMMEAGMNIDRNSLANMYHTISSFAGHDPVNIIQMHQMGMEINEQSLEQFEAFKNYETQIGEGMRQIAADIPEMYGELLADGKDDAAMQFMKAVVDTFLEASGNTVNGETATGTVRQDGVLWQELSQEAAPQNSLQAMIVDGKVVGSAPLPEEGMVMTKEAADAVRTPKDIITVLTEQEVPEAGKELPVEGREQTVEEGKTAVSGKEAAVQTTLEQTKDVLLGMMKESGVPEEQLSQLAKQPASAHELLRTTSELMRRIDSGMLPEELTAKLKDDIKNVFLSDGFKNTIQQAVQKQWFLEPSEVADKGTVESLYRRLDQQTKQLTDTLSELARPETSLAQDLSNMNQNMNFMNQMNQMYQYIQLPLKMNGGEATGDLFVYTDKKSLAQKDGNVSAMLHLDMQNLGMVDVYASMTAAKNVFTKFYLESDEMLDFIEANIHILNERLTGRGYQLTTEMAKHEEKKDLIAQAAVKKDGAVPKAIAQYSFDIRA